MRRSYMFRCSIGQLTEVSAVPYVYMLEDCGADCFTVFVTVGLIIHPILVTVRPANLKQD